MLYIIIIVGIIWAIIAFARSRKKSPGSSPNAGAEQVRAKRDPNVYRPKAAQKTSRNTIVFKEPQATPSSITDQEIKDLVDALTGAPLQLSSGLFQCQRCKVFYQSHSFEVIQSENSGRCVACLNTEIVNVTSRHAARGRNADVNVITLDNYRQYIGHVINFEGQVHTVLTSRRGKDYAVMFENKSWTRGFKMVVFRGNVASIGGVRYLHSMVGRRIKVRGLLICHKTFGHEIIISDRSMILGIQ